MNKEVYGENIDISNPAFESIRQHLNIQVGGLVQNNDVIYRIAQVLDFETVIGTQVESGRSMPLRVNDLRPVLGAKSTDNDSTCDISDIADEDWKIAEQRFAVIKPLLNSISPGRHEVEKRAKEAGINVATLYRWLKKYKAIGVISALIPKKRGWKEGGSRVSASTEEVIKSVIKDFYLTSQRQTVAKTVAEVERCCQLRGIVAPNPSSIRDRLAKITEKESLRGRGFSEKAKNKFMPTPGSFPNADYPLAVIQIDHTPVDIILVDDVYRKPIGRPWITLAIDVYSRMVMGYYLSFDPPSETSVAMCVAHSMLPKDEWLLLHKVDATWPVWGVPRTIHVDNGADFRSNNFQQSCLMYGINLEFRPVKQPRYGGHIERVLGTLLTEIHQLPGTTFSSVNKREGYDSEKNAVFTKSEFEEWLVTLICKVYHQRLHSGIGMSPSRKWEIGIFGNAETPGIGLPPRPSDRLTILLDFLPSFRRTIQTFGVTIDRISYYAEALRHWINTTDPDNPRKKRKFIFRRDPRDISTLWFFDPALKQYYKVPFADLSLPPISIWEYQQVRAILKKEGIKSVNESQILRALTELRTKVDDAKEKTKKARRQAQRRKEHEKKVSPAAPLPIDKLKTTFPAINLSSDLIDGDIDTFGEIE